jgi:hypothetical protein
MSVEISPMEGRTDPSPALGKREGRPGAEEAVPLMDDGGNGTGSRRFGPCVLRVAMALSLALPQSNQVELSEEEESTEWMGDATAFNGRGAVKGDGRR